MKIICPVHGAHFQDEIDDVVACKYFWKQGKMTRMPKALKRQLVEHLMGFDVDQAAGQFNWSVGFSFSAKKIKGGFKNEFETTVPGYRDWTDAQRRNYQRKTFRRKLAKQTKKRKSDIMRSEREKTDGITRTTQKRTSQTSPPRAQRQRRA